jgi:hypothetical protein
LVKKKRVVVPHIYTHATVQKRKEEVEVNENGTKGKMSVGWSIYTEVSVGGCWFDVQWRTGPGRIVGYLVATGREVITSVGMLLCYVVYRCERKQSKNIG